MRVFVTGASGWIGSATVVELLEAGHEVVGLARSDDSAAALEKAGAGVRRGSLDDTESLRIGAAESDGVVHLAYIHDFSDMVGAAKADRNAVDAMASVLEGSNRPLLIASGTLGLSSGRVGTEHDSASASVNPRIATAAATLELADRGIRSIVVRFAPTVHGAGDHGFISTITGVARDKGVSAYVGDGTNRWPAVHRSDAARLVRLGIENAPARTVLHAVAEEGIEARTIAEAIGRGLDIPVTSVATDDAADHFGWIGAFFAMDAPASNHITRELLGWEPTGPALLEDLAAGHYFRH